MARATDEERALRAADKAHKNRVKGAEKALASAEKGEEVERYRTLTLYADRIEFGKNSYSLNGVTTKVETSGSKTKTKDRTVDTRKLFLIVENEDTGFTMDCGADDEPKIRGLAQKIRLAEASSTAAGERRRAATAEAGTALAAAKADRSEVEKAEAALGPDQIARTRRRAKYAWVKWVAAAAVALVVVAAVFGGGGSGDKQPVATTTSSTQAAASASTGHPDHHGTRALRGGARSSRGRQTPP